MQVGTPITVPSQGFVDLGRIASMELNHKVHPNCQLPQHLQRMLRSLIQQFDCREPPKLLACAACA